MFFLRGLILAMLIIGPIPAAQAKVFNFQKVSMSTYLRGTYGFTALGREAYAPGIPSTVSFDGAGVSQAYSAEFGLGFASKSMGWRLGVELLNPAVSKDINGSNATPTHLMTVNSEVFSVIPQINLEIVLRQGPGWRMYMGGGLGYHLTSLKNTVSFAAGSTFGLSNYIEEGSSSGIMGQGMTGFEFSFFDNVAFSIDLGYRFFTASGFKASRDAITPCGTFYSGNTLRNCDGTDRTLNLSGLFSAANFRIYIY